MHDEVEFEVAAPVEQVWKLLVDVERWPEWSESMTSVRRLGTGPLAVGERAVVKQPKLPKLTWEVTELAEGSSFVWVSRTPGVLTTGSHYVSPAVSADGTPASKVRLAVSHTGPGAKLVGLFANSLTRSYLQMERRGLTARAESTAAQS
ncbi:SRPBCC family protein [Actinopolymorpha rutila]|uniref:Putative membrane protein n=1 Tax=Actinopolymorpha rutila TaxID=446787 RepID=A0A852ZE55_9ACTN|nr:SRPBCC family protein [Actinopolymorpha rutila]NYH91461.1 putative membrane protein [Actinopolymorpha rutila]